MSGGVVSSDQNHAFKKRASPFKTSRKRRQTNSKHLWNAFHGKVKTSERRRCAQCVTGGAVRAKLKWFMVTRAQKIMVFTKIGMCACFCVC